MKNDKILNLLIAFFLTLIVFNLFLPKNKTEVVKTWIELNAIKKDYTIPNIPEIQIVNNSDKTINFDSCKNLSIQKDWVKIENISSTSPKFCVKAAIESKQTYKINLESISKLFTISWNYDFILTKDKEYRVSTVESDKWFFNNFFSTLFFAPVYNLFVLIISNIPGHNLWLSIILITILIRLLVLVPQHRIMLNSKKMQAIQPKIKEIQEKYKWDQAKIWMELLEIYKREKVNPMWSCLPLLIQMPILIVLYWIIIWVTSSANYYYLYWNLSSFDISKINPNFLWLNLIKQEWKSGLILAVLIGFFQWWQIKMSLTVHEKKKNHWKIIEKDVKVDDPISEFMPDPNIMNAFMLWGMPVMLAFSSYFFPSWVWIYWLIGTIFTLVQQFVVNKIWDKKIVTKEGHEIIVKNDKKTKK